MYVPSAFQEEDPAQLLAFMQAHPFATLVSIQDGIPVATHVPLVIRQEGENLMLFGHLARANPQWQAFSEQDSLVIFSGPHAYISPTLYEKPENVPTWNYIAVHAYGRPQPLHRQDNPEAMELMIEAMIATYEASYGSQWHSLPPAYREGMMQSIVGFAMTVTRLQGKYKLSQNRSPHDQQTVAASLAQSADPNQRALAEAMFQSISSSAHPEHE